MTQYKKVNEKYLGTLTFLWNNMKELYKLSSNPGLELYRMQSMMYVFARQVAKVHAITERYKEAEKDKDLSELHRIKYISDRMGDEKAYAILWEGIAEDYDNIVEAFKEESEATTKVRSSYEILERAKEYRKQAEEIAAEQIEIDL